MNSSPANCSTVTSTAREGSIGAQGNRPDARSCWATGACGQRITSTVSSPMRALASEIEKDGTYYQSKHK